MVAEEVEDPSSNCDVARAIGFDEGWIEESFAFKALVWGLENWVNGCGSAARFNKPLIEESSLILA